MADARALLRAHQAENRIKHPHAAYSDAGKLLCKVCHEAIKAESLWDSHVRGAGHRQKLQSLQATSSKPTGDEASSNKRKHDDVDEVMSDEDLDEDATRAKRSKTNAPSSATGEKDRESKDGNQHSNRTAPLLSRRTSNTPVQGVEIAIPSRPATPLAGSNSSTSTPRITPVGRSPLIGPDGAPIFVAGGASGQALPISTEPVAEFSKPTASTSQAGGQAQPNEAAAPGGQVDEDEWAAFEAEVAEDTAATGGAATNPYDGATISAPAMTTEQMAARSQEEENERRKHVMEAQLADEREEAARQLEDEFDEMEELEGRVRRLKERREELRKGSMANLRGAVASTAASGGSGAMKNGGAATADGKENGGAVGAEQDDDDEEEEDDDDEWDSFRFR